MFDTRGPVSAPARVTDVVWSSRFRIQHRLAETYRRGPFLLMGDAAHVHSPAGGQGMNTGLVDAIVLGDALTRVVRNGEPAGVLDAYSDRRRPAAGAVLALASRLTVVATMKHCRARLMRNAALRLLNHVQPFRRQLTMALSGLNRRKFARLPASV